jgi:hypothetical protein
MRNWNAGSGMYVWMIVVGKHHKLNNLLNGQIRNLCCSLLLDYNVI